MSKCKRCGVGCECEEFERIEDQMREAGYDESHLDDMVHEAASHLASTVNNGGMLEQIEFLLQNGFNCSSLLEAKNGG